MKAEVFRVLPLQTCKAMQLPVVLALQSRVFHNKAKGKLIIRRCRSSVAFVFSCI